MKQDLKPIIPNWTQLLKFNYQEIKISKTKRNYYKYLFQMKRCCHIYLWLLQCVCQKPHLEAAWAARRGTWGGVRTPSFSHRYILGNWFNLSELPFSPTHIKSCPSTPQNQYEAEITDIKRLFKCCKVLRYCIMEGTSDPTIFSFYMFKSVTGHLLFTPFIHPINIYGTSTTCQMLC